MFLQSIVTAIYSNMTRGGANPATVTFSRGHECRRPWMRVWYLSDVCKGEVILHRRKMGEGWVVEEEEGGNTSPMSFVVKEVDKNCKR